MTIPEDVSFIIDTLEKAGFEAYAVGGCVRDTLLSCVPGDWDITTSAKPEEVKKLFKRTVDTGIAHGTVTVMLKKNGYEVTTYRIDGEYEDARHPKSVEFTASLTEDLKRRDFTINAMAYNPRTGIVDEFGGIQDLQDGIIRCVGNPTDRFHEDALRMLRAVRFSAQLGFQIEEKTKEAIREMGRGLEKVSRERVQVELTKLLISPHPENIRLLYELGISGQFFPEFQEMMETGQNSLFHCFSVGEHTIRVVQAIRPTPRRRWTALLHDCAKPACRTVDARTGRDHFIGHAREGAGRAVRILRGLKCDNQLIHKTEQLILWHDERFSGGKRDVRRCLGSIGPEMFELLMEVIHADNAGKNPELAEHFKEEEERIRSMYREVIEAGDCYNLKMLAVSGKDLMEAGVKPGEEMGNLLQEMLQEVLANPALNDRELLLKKHGLIPN